MSGWVLTLDKAPAQRVDVSCLTPAALAELGAEALGAMPLWVGNRQQRVDELFRLAPGEDDTLVFAGDCGRLERIGAGMTQGRIRVEGDAGAYLGQALHGGSIEVRGSVGLFAGSGMRSGLVRIAGNAGDFAGAALPGDMRGMAGGTLIIEGSAGARLGDRMRRGTILVGGDCGDYCGSRMIAGTVAVSGRCGDWAGFGLRRGTLLLGQGPARMLPTFSDCGVHELGFLRLMPSHWATLPGPIGSRMPEGIRVRRYLGDLGNGGRGEILLAAG